MGRKQKLELTWIGKENRPKLEPRILLEDPAKSYHAAHQVTEGDRFDNRLIFGDNLLALKALEAEFAGKVKCVFIDPPYNTGNAFEDYEDGLEHSLWLSLMRERIILLRRLMSAEGFFCCQIDDAEGAYLKVLLDEIFGRSNYLTTIYMQVRYGNKTLAEDNDYQKVIEQCLIYAKDSKLAKVVKEREPYKVEKFEWRIEEIEHGEVLELGRKKVEVFKPHQYVIKKVEPNLKGLKETWATGSLVRQSGSSGEFLDRYIAPRKTIDGLSCLYKVYGMGEDGLGYRYMSGPKKATAKKGKFYSGIPLKTLEKIKNGDADKEKPIRNFYDFAGSFGNCRHEGGVDFRGGKKPESLLQIVLKHFSCPNDLVLDSFAGSGTTAAVAHKMGRQWIAVEIGKQAYTHIRPRLVKVINGEDAAGITKAVDWKGGGGFRYYHLAPSLLEKDKWDNWVINKTYNPEMLAEALCKLEGFTYAPSETIYWQQGHSTERDFIYVTTQTLNHHQLTQLSEAVGDSRSLLVLCMAFRSTHTFENLTVKKIPKHILSRCEWGHDDYSLKVENLPQASPEPDPPATKKTPASNPDQLVLGL